MKETASFGGLLRAMAGELLRRRVSRPRGPVGECAVQISFPRRPVLAGVLLFGIVALSAPQAPAAQTPAPDPYPSRNAAPSVPAPDPYLSPPKSKRKPTPTPAPAPPPAPAAAPRSSASEVADLPQTTPKAQKPKASANQSGKNTTERVASPRTTREEKPNIAVAAAAVAAARDATSARAPLLGGLALLALVLASGSLLFLLTRTEGWETSP